MDILGTVEEDKKSTLGILTLGAPELNMVTEVVQEGDPGVHALVLKLIDKLNEINGECGQGALGLAANQIGDNRRVAVIRWGNEWLVLINPECEPYNSKSTLGLEGCLSIPGVRRNIPRYKQIMLHYQDEQMNRRKLKLKGMEARCAQHEIDHLLGVTIVDYK